MRAVEHVLKYSSDSYTDGIYYCKDSQRMNKLWGWVDPEFAVDLEARRSHTGYVLMLNGGPVSWIPLASSFYDWSVDQIDVTSSAQHRR
jgi:hypothetical protein